MVYPANSNPIDNQYRFVRLKLGKKNWEPLGLTDVDYTIATNANLNSLLQFVSRFRKFKEKTIDDYAIVRDNTFIDLKGVSKMLVTVQKNSSKPTISINADGKISFSSSFVKKYFTPNNIEAVVVQYDKDNPNIIVLTSCDKTDNNAFALQANKKSNYMYISCRAVADGNKHMKMNLADFNKNADGSYEFTINKKQASSVLMA